MQLAQGRLSRATRPGSLGRGYERRIPACLFSADVGPVALAFLRALTPCAAPERRAVGVALREPPPPLETPAVFFCPPPMRLLRALFCLLMRATDRRRAREFRRANPA